MILSFCIPPVHLSDGPVIAHQAAIEKTILTVVERTNIISFAFNAIYDLEDGTDAYTSFFDTSDEGDLRVTASVVPTKPRFTQFAQQISDARDGRRGCSIKVKLSGDVDGDSFKLLKAGYRASTDDTTTVSRLPDARHSAGHGHIASAPPDEKSRITFRLNYEGHTQLWSILVPTDYEQDSDAFDEEYLYGVPGYYDEE